MEGRNGGETGPDGAAADAVTGRGVGAAAGYGPGPAGEAYSGISGRRTATGESALALLGDDGVVAAWARGADRPGPDAAVGRRAGFFLGPDVGLTVSALAERKGSPGGWSSGTPAAEAGHRAYRVLWLCRLANAGGEVCWLLSAHQPALGAALRARLRPDAGVAREPVGAALWDPELRCTSVNDVLERQDGVPRSDRLGRRMSEVLPGPDADVFERLMRSLVHSGIPAIDYRYQLLDENDPAAGRWFAVSLFRLDAADGTVLAVCSLTVDITRARSVHEHLAVLGEASRNIGTSRDIIRTAQEMAEFTVPLIADYVTVDLAESVPLGDRPLALVSPDVEGIPVFRRAGVASVHPELNEAAWRRGQPVFVPLSSPFTDVLTTGRSFYHPVFEPPHEHWMDHKRISIAQLTGMHSLIMVAVQAPDAPVLGIAVFIRTANSPPFDEDDLLLAEELVAQTSRRLENMRGYAVQHSTALALQRNLLPRHLAGGPCLEIATHYEAADAEVRVGGDWFDVIVRHRSRVALVVGDVVGHGIGAAAAMGRLRTAVRTFESMDLRPDELLRRLDELVMRFAEDDLSDTAAVSTTSGATCLILIYDPTTRRAVAASAGHLPPLIISPGGTAEFRHVPVGAPIGTGLSPYESVEFEIPLHSVIALYTDGLVEGRQWPIEAGMSRLAQALSQPGVPLDELLRAAFEAQPTDEQSDRAALLLKQPKDDATLLLARTRPADAEAEAAFEAQANQ